MVEGLREFDDSRGRCLRCSKLVFKDEEWVIAYYSHDISHKDCEQDYMRRASQIGAIQI